MFSQASSRTSRGRPRRASRRESAAPMEPPAPVTSTGPPESASRAAAEGGSNGIRARNPLQSICCRCSVTELVYSAAVCGRGADARRPRANAPSQVLTGHGCIRALSKHRSLPFDSIDAFKQNHSSYTPRECSQVALSPRKSLLAGPRQGHADSGFALALGNRPGRRTLSPGRKQQGRSRSRALVS